MKSQMDSPILLPFIILIISNGASGIQSLDPACNQKLRNSVSADVTRVVGVFLTSKTEFLAEKAKLAAAAQVSESGVALGDGLVDRIAVAVEGSVRGQLQGLAPQIEPMLKAWLDTTLKRICIEENCCFQYSK